LEIFAVLLGKPVDGGAEGDNFAPSLEAGFETGVDVVVVFVGKLVGGFLGVVDHAAADKTGLKFGQ